MKFRVLLAVLLLSLGFSSCNPDATGVGPGVNGANGNVMVASINGVTWGAEDGYVQKTSTFGLEMYGVHGSTSRMVIVISPYNGLQSYQLNGITKITFTENGVDYISTTGQINVNADTDQYIEGTFNCELVSNTGSQSLLVTGGQFLIPKY